MENNRTCVEVISTEIIKPSSPTPQNLEKLKFSYLDQLASPTYIPLIFFYEGDETNSNHAQISQLLKTSLSDTLTSFYPLAGRIEENSVVNCNDEGVEFIDARVRSTLKDAVLSKEPTMEELNKYIPINSINGGLLAVQITFFDCGGVSIGTCFSHQIADLKSVTAFVDMWSAICRGSGEGDHEEISRLISFDLSSYFPGRDFPSSAFWGRSGSDDQNLTMKRFVFDKVKLEALRQTATLPSDSTVKNPTRVELVSAFIWKNSMEATKSKSKSETNIQTPGQKISAAFHSVNLRARKHPPKLLENTFGNCKITAFAYSKIASDDLDEAGDEQLHELVSELRNSIRAIDDDYISESQNGFKYLSDLVKFYSLLAKDELEWCGFSSWCRFGLYEVDYGWGKPVFFGTTFAPMKNFTVLVDSKGGEGIEAWVTMGQDKVEVLENQIKLISTLINVNHVES